MRCALPDAIRSALDATRRRARVRTALLSLSAGGVIFALLLLVLRLFGGAPRSVSLAFAAIAGVMVAALILFRSLRLSLVEVAQQIEGTMAADNLIVTAAELIERPRPVQPEIQRAIATQAEQRLRDVRVEAVVPLAQPLAVLAAITAGCVVLATLTTTPPSAAVLRMPTAAAESQNFVVRVAPPPYTRRPAEVIEQPVQIAVIRGSQVRIERGDGTLIRDWQASESAALEINVSGAATKFLSVIVLPDAAPALRIVTPGKDSAFAEPKGRVAIGVEARDDLGLAELIVKFTKASGGGENVTFTESELPLRLERSDERHWQGRADLVLDSLGLGDGDVIVYRAVGRDTNPQGVPVQSEPYLIEIGKNAVVADAGFALPADERKYAISQQMVIYKTQQLIARGRTPDFLAQAQGIAVEQRMVRAEVVFLGGGEVQDELEEAANSNDVTEGRLQNTGRVEMLRAINAMSRAEAQLNDGRAEEALVLEKQALASLERALDRRRYFLRTLPDRSRIDNSRRLTGERKEARSWIVDTVPPSGPSGIERARAVMRDLAAATTGTAAVDSALAARIAAIDPASSDLQQAAVMVASASTEATRRTALESAMQAVSAHALATLPGSASVPLPGHSYDGRLGDQLRARGGGRQ